VRILHAAAASRPFVDWSWISDNRGQIGSDLVQHLELTLLAVGIGLAISVPLAIVAWRLKVARAPLIALVSVLYVVPSLALFTLLGPVTGYFSTLTAEIALVGYTLLILVWNTLAGLEAVPEDARDAARAVGYSSGASLTRVELPLALPYVFAGLRVATVTVIGLVTVTALIGLGGLGQLFTEGLQGSAGGPLYTPIVVGLVLSILMAALADLLIVAVERVAVPWSRAERRATAGAR
jgi:osmoprotectant transport system permease protein